jgi:hypothetical protein
MAAIFFVLLMLVPSVLMKSIWIGKCQNVLRYIEILLRITIQFKTISVENKSSPSQICSSLYCSSSRFFVCGLL